MKLSAIRFANFRGLSSVDVVDCSEFNVFIGKNNAGKSSVLFGIELVLGHLNTGRIVNENSIARPSDQFTNRNVSIPFQIGIDFEARNDELNCIKQHLIEDLFGVEKAVSQISTNIISVIICGSIHQGALFTYLSQISFGKTERRGDDLKSSGSILFEANADVARELFAREVSVKRLKSQQKIIDGVTDDLPPFEYLGRDPGIRSQLNRLRSVPPNIRSKIESAFSGAKSSEEFQANVARLKSDVDLEIESIENEETSGHMVAFSGSVKTPPGYVTRIMSDIGSTKLLHFRETRSPVGVEEAQQLLQLKTKRGGAERLGTVQKTVRALLGVDVDAFEPEQVASDSRSPRRAAEMDIDDFLVEANGAGIREALRIVLDIELRQPEIVLIEEPEVHLHPGLERALHSYLSEKKDTTQIFISTHSTNFLDVSESQNVYILSRGENKLTSLEHVATGDELLRIPEEIGLRPSTVLMFDRLVFVEGPSDEEILRRLSSRLKLDLAAQGVAFVRMGGSGNIRHYAADATLDLLSRRQIPMWFLLDRDEKDDAEIQGIIRRLGDRAELVALKRREIENYFLDDPEAIRQLILLKGKMAGREVTVSLEEVVDQLKSTTAELKVTLVKRRVDKVVLSPIYPSRMEGDWAEKLKLAKREIDRRIEEAEEVVNSVQRDVDDFWPKDGQFSVPGSLVLEGVLKLHDLQYSKQNDGPRLAEIMDTSRLNAEIVGFLKKVSASRR